MPTQKNTKQFKLAFVKIDFDISRIFVADILQTKNYYEPNSTKYYELVDFSQNVKQLKDQMLPNENFDFYLLRDFSELGHKQNALYRETNDLVKVGRHAKGCSWQPYTLAVENAEPGFITSFLTPNNEVTRQNIIEEFHLPKYSL